MFAIFSICFYSDEMASSSQQSGKMGDALDATPCERSACISVNMDQEQNDKTVKGTILVSKTITH